MINTRTLTEHILVVDDDSRIRQMLSRNFEEEGYRVSSASDGQEMRMPGQAANRHHSARPRAAWQGRLAFARDIRARSDVPIIMLTGRNDAVDRVFGLEVGADDYIAKPFHLRGYWLA